MSRGPPTPWPPSEADEGNSRFSGSSEPPRQAVHDGAPAATFHPRRSWKAVTKKPHRCRCGFPDRSPTGTPDGPRGSRTPVREAIRPCVYVRSLLFHFSRPFGGQQTTSRGPATESHPGRRGGVHGPARFNRRLQPGLGPGSTEDGHVRKLTQPAPFRCWHLKVCPLFIEVADTSARSTDFTRHVESRCGPFYQSTAVIYWNTAT